VEAASMITQDIPLAFKGAK